ncbi:MAG: phosphatidate cytidylyltransferase [Pseudomonadota bacterium]|nr:phosphatidate cytidylyltransferase [Pseudomonadota bacterium]
MNVAMVRPLNKFYTTNFLRRLLSGLVGAPIALAVVYLGSPFFDVLVIFLTTLMAWEWMRFSVASFLNLWDVLIDAAIVMALVSTYLGWPHFAFLVLVFVGGLLYFVLGNKGIRGARHCAIGMVLFGAFAISCVSLRYFPVVGFEFTLWILVTVWLTDVGAYFFGRLIGGWRLASRISPNKTWAGLAGGVLLASSWSGIWLTSTGYSDLHIALIVGGVAGCFAQLGDLAMSAVKRNFGVKDSSNLIPGHGGFIDRLDGFLFTVPLLVVTLFVLE